MIAVLAYSLPLLPPQYLDLVRTLPGSNVVAFPHCKCDARKVGHVIVSISRSHIRLKACSEEGVLEDQEHTFPWEMVVQHEADVEEGAFTFQYTREGKSPRWVRVYSRYVSTCPLLEVVFLIGCVYGVLGMSFIGRLVLSECSLFLPQYEYMEECVQRIKEEFKWNDP